jgi:hypothetical protein
MMSEAYNNTVSLHIIWTQKSNRLSSSSSWPQIMRRFRRTNMPYHTSGCQTPASREIRPKESMWDLWHCSRFIAEKFGSSSPTITLMHHQDYCIGPALARNTKGFERTTLLQLVNYTLNRTLVIP